jgi:hypothetical protein
MYTASQEMYDDPVSIKTQYPSMDDAHLAQQARADSEAFAKLYRRHVHIKAGYKPAIHIHRVL